MVKDVQCDEEIKEVVDNLEERARMWNIWRRMEVSGGVGLEEVRGVYKRIGMMEMRVSGNITQMRWRCAVYGDSDYKEDNGRGCTLITKRMW